MKIAKKFIILPLLLISLALALTGCANQAAENQNENVKKPVNIQDIAFQDEVTTELTASGTIIPKQYAVIRSLTNGTVESVMPLGAQVAKGQSLFRVRDDNIENNYFNSLQNSRQTNILADESVNQTQLALNSAQARGQLAQKNLDIAKQQTDQAYVNAADSAIIAYGSAYNTLNQFFNFISVGSVGNLEYKYRDITTPDLEIREQANLQFITATKDFLKLTKQTDLENLDEDLTKMNLVIAQTKILVDTTSVLLQNALGNVASLTSDQTLITTYQTQINGQASAILASQNGLRHTITANDLAIAAANNNLELANIELANSQIAFNNSQTSAEVQKTLSQSQLDNAAYSFNNLSLPSPFSGTIISTLVEPGQQVSPGQDIVELGNLSIVEIEVSVDPDFAKQIKEGDRVKINGQNDGIIYQKQPTGDIQSGKVGIKINADNQDNQLAAGEIAQVTFSLTYQASDLIIVPISSVTIESNETYVFVVEDGRAVKRPVTLGQIFGSKVSVSFGLQPGDQMIIRNGVFVSEGEAVEIK
ncbi:MAG: efflux RND transporter periplasmic adaptor subunit [Patescibacteria group bacterium]|jgi:RND family efflux transporter MFP subunit|nr:efflux RND transporter periplasmic adaptor subunit [Patescibacteria group bacterium]